MNNRTENNTASNVNIAEYVIVGAGPAALCAIPTIIHSGVSKKDIIWIDPQFKVGDFGTTLSVGSSVPGNTAVENYQKVNHEIYRIIECAPQKNQLFTIDNRDPKFVCTLREAAEPLQYITAELRKVIPSAEGTVTKIITSDDGLMLEVKLTDGTTTHIKSKRVILATGAKAKSLKLPLAHSDIKMIHPNIAFIRSELDAYLRAHPGITTVAVIGSSHSAALATMHLLKAGLTVKQFMNKEYRYATPSTSPTGIKYTMFDNTGLKGDVAEFTRDLLSNIESDKSNYKGKLALYFGKDRQEVSHQLEEHLIGCSHVVVTIGYEPLNTLEVNEIPLSALKHNNITTEFTGIRGLFGIGAAFPQQVKAISGEIENAVGVGKFWATANNPAVLDIWKNGSASTPARYPDNIKVMSEFIGTHISRYSLWQPALLANVDKLRFDPESYLSRLPKDVCEDLLIPMLS